MYNEYLKREKDYNYEQLQQMREHSKKYNLENDKRSFLKNISPVEQKMILLSSSDPYEVLAHLDNINMEPTNLMLQELTDNEIINLLALFSSEDKKQFYATFSKPFIVNRFIEHDSKFFNHVPELNLDRKIELLDNSNMETLDATKKVYESVSDEEKQEVIDSVDNFDAEVALNNLTNDDIDMLNDNKIIENSVDNEQFLEINKEDNKLENNEQINKEQLLEEKEEFKDADKLNKEDLDKKTKVDEEKESINNENLDVQAEIQEEDLTNGKNLDKQNQQLANEEQLSNLNNENSPINLFQEAKNNSEKIYIQQVKNFVEQKLLKDDNIKTM